MATYDIYPGPFMVDCTILQGNLVDIVNGGMRGLRTDWPGFTFVTLELANAVPLVGVTAGVPQDVYDHFVMCNQTVDAVDERLAVARKLVEVLEESRAFYIDARQNDISLMVDAMRSRAQRRKDTSLLVPFEQVIKYAGQIGEKAAQTRKKNEQAKAEAQAQAQASAPAKPAAVNPPSPPNAPAAPPAPPAPPA